MRVLRQALVLGAAAAAGPTLASDLAACRALADDAARLACYDRAAGRVAPASAGASDPVEATPATGAGSASAPQPAARSDASSSGWLRSGSYRPQTFSQRWELDASDQDGVFKIKPHQPVYLLPVSWRERVNVSPCSPNPANCAIGIGENYKNVEAKFQVSFKTKAWQDIFGSPLDLWLGYSQQSFWQVYDVQDSRPFRENDFQPEAWLTMPLSLGPDWLRWRMFNLGLLHQSNGESDPLSRSWNRVYATFGFTSGNASIQIKPWWRLSESPAEDNNADIKDYVGRIEIQVVYPFGAHVASARLRNNLRFGSSEVPNRSSIQADWAFPLYGMLHGYLQASHGWGDSLQNYNFRNSGLGLGVSLVEWR